MEISEIQYVLRNLPTINKTRFNISGNADYIVRRIQKLFLSNTYIIFLIFFKSVPTSDSKFLTLYNKFIESVIPDNIKARFIINSIAILDSEMVNYDLIFRLKTKKMIINQSYLSLNPPEFLFTDRLKVKRRVLSERFKFITTSEAMQHEKIDIEFESFLDIIFMIMNDHMY